MYPNPFIVTNETGCEGFNSIFSLIRRICAIKEFSYPNGLSPHAASHKIGMTDLPEGTFEFGTLLSFAGYSFTTSMPVLAFMLFVSSRFENMWIPLGIGVAGFLSGMALATSNIKWLCVHPFVVMLKPAVATNAQPDMTIVIIALIETAVLLFAGLWTAKNLRYE